MRLATWLALSGVLVVRRTAGDLDTPSLGPDDVPPTESTNLALLICILVVLLSLSAVFAGLGLGLMSLDLIGLEIVVAAGEDKHATLKEKHQGDAARRIIPVRRNGNLLLTTLLMGNVAVTSLTSIIMADMTSGLTGFFVSTILIVVFGEIVPQAICTKHALEIGGRVIPFVKLLIAIFYIFAKPVSMVLDASLGEDIGTVFTKRELSEMIEIHEKQRMIDPEEGGILRGAMGYSSKTAESIMTPVNEEQVQISSFIHVFGRNIHHVGPECSLDVLLQTFKQECTHLALVKSVESQKSAEPTERLEGIVTLEDVVEEILQTEILDEGDVTASNETTERKRRLSCLYGRAGRLRLADLTKSEGTIEQVDSLAQHLQETNPIFRSKNARGVAINTLALAEFLSSCPILEFRGGATTPEELLTRNVVTSHCIVVLQGRLRVESAGGRVELGSWGMVAADSLVVQEGLFLSDVTVRTLPGVATKVLRIPRGAFQQLLHPLPRRSSSSAL
ncbi:hypothetical protein Poli38472_000448 [Pythium oligandrum]|uniref:CNNM transmembrane domain-containing protein n=1 Tax=Pythium oligandrum TaxID=41045 RepID=A0A8K1FFC6_PYTOL|nr:hypothetical protein Poli38472_000448 [Pythium oligandrum]|eukprot:TMW60406.1 hypothetical protein Poli38472_000448 [Pythium oligandrum]